MLTLKELELAYPEMMPYKGDGCIGDCKESIVLIGESHYLPEETKCNTAPDVWYSGKAILDDTDRYWINIAGILRDYLPTGLKNQAHSIWKLSALAINDAGPQFEGDTGEILTKIYQRIIAFNFFMRPAKQGETLKWQLSKSDIDIAQERVKRLFSTIRPRGVIILSSCVADNFNFQTLDELGIPCVCTVHPGCVWWNRRSRRSNYKTGREIITEFIRQIDYR